MGVIAPSYAGRALLGSTLAGTLPAPKRGLGLLLVSLFTLSGLLLIQFGFLRTMWKAAGVALTVGVASDYTDNMFT